MSEEVWKYWEEADYPKHKDCCDGWNGPNSDPDHCKDRCAETIEWFKAKNQLLSARLKAMEAVVGAALDALEAGCACLGYVCRCDSRNNTDARAKLRAALDKENGR